MAVRGALNVLTHGLGIPRAKKVYAIEKVAESSPIGSTMSDGSLLRLQRLEGSKTVSAAQEISDYPPIYTFEELARQREHLAPYINVLADQGISTPTP